MRKFIAINVGVGDAFYLETDKKRILVDGGHSKTGFPTLFTNNTGHKNVDIVVCTHNDFDHVYGLIGFFDAGYTAKELWLPGSWACNIDKLINNYEGFILDSFKEVISKSLRNSTLTDIEINNNKLSDAISEPEQYLDLNDLDNIIQASELNTTEPIKLIHPRYYLYNSFFDIGIFRDIIEAASNIYELFISAYNTGCKIRWFEYDKLTPSSGGEDFLVPINCHEIFSIRKKMSNLEYLHLTVINKESLVFFHPNDDAPGGILFSADSDFSFPQLLPDLNINSIITVPHHGSSENTAAYFRLQSSKLISDDTIFVRSDKKTSKRPCSTYLALKQSQRYCTLCRNQLSIKKPVVLENTSNNWLSVNTANCCCK